MTVPTIANLAVGLWALPLMLVAGNRIRRLFIRHQPPGFVLMQAVLGVYAAFTWLHVVESQAALCDVAGLAFATLYVWRSRERLHELLLARAEDLPDDCPVKLGAACPVMYEDGPDTRIVPKKVVQ